MLKHQGLFHKLTMGFAVVGVINGVLMQETFKASGANSGLTILFVQNSWQVH